MIIEDLGLIRIRPQLSVSNRSYQEVIPRELTWSTQTMIANQELAWYHTSELAPNRRLNLDRLLEAFGTGWEMGSRRVWGC